MEIAPSVHLIPGIIANPYLIVEPQGLTLIDAGMPGAVKKILRYMAGLGYAPQELKRIIITHSDFDHVGGLAELKARTGARVFASPIEAAAIASGRPSRDLKIRNALARSLFNLVGRVFKAAPAKVDDLLAQGNVLPILGGLQVLETPGHTPGHISLYAPVQKILFCGDSIVSVKGVLRGSTGSNTWDQAQADASVLFQQALGALTICSGHGTVVKKTQVTS